MIFSLILLKYWKYFFLCSLFLWKEGREYDKKGNLHEWWQHGTILKFKERMKCFQEQYSKYMIGNDHVNGKQTLGENVADNGGLTSAFHVRIHYW